MKILKSTLLIALAILATLTGCGPGTGGTGTGPTVSTSAPTSPVSGPVTYAGAQSTSGAVFGGSSPERVASVFGPSVSALKNAVLSLDVQRVDLRKACQSFSYVGDWTIGTDGDVRLLGTYSATRLLSDGQAEVTTFVATASMVFASGNASSNNVSAIVKDSAGSVLMGPYQLQLASNSGAAVTACSRAQ